MVIHDVGQIMRHMAILIATVLAGCVNSTDIPPGSARHLETILVPHFSLTNASLHTAVTALQEASVQWIDGTPYGVSFIVTTTYGGGDPDDFFDEAEVHEYVPPSITMETTNANLHMLIQGVCDQSGMTFEVDRGLVIMKPKIGQHPPAR